MAANIPPSREHGIPDLRNCPKCKKRMTSPRLLLSCWHILCENCLADAIEGKKRGETFQCFVCSKNVPVPWEGVAEFPVPLFLQCQVENDGRVPQASTADVVCYHHYEEKVALYCTTCERAICQVCKMTEDSHHKDHPCISISDSFAKYDSKKEELCEHVQNLSEKIQEKNDTVIELNRQKNELTSEEDEADRNIETHFQYLVDVLNKQKEERKCKLCSIVKSEQDYLDMRRRDVVNSSYEMEMIKQLAVQLMENATPREMMLHQKPISSVMAHHEAQANDTIFRKNKVEYVPCNDIKGTIGKISRGITLLSGLKLVAEFSTKAEVDKDTPDIVALAVDNAMNIVVPDRKNNNLKLFDRSGRLVSVWSGDGRHQLRCPAGVCCTSGGNIAICNKGNKKILFLDSQQRVDRTQTVSIGDYKCTAVVFSKDYVVFTAGTFQVRLQSSSVPSCVVVFSKHDGRVVREIRKDKDGSDLFSCPYGIALTKQGNLVVTDIDKHCVYVLTMEGEVLHRYGRPGSASEGDDCLYHPYGVCVDKLGHILVPDKINDRIHMLSSKAEFICHLVTGGDGLVSPQGIALDQEGHLIVSEGLTGKIKVFDYLI